MAFDAYFPKITLPSNKSDIRKGDGLAMIINGRVMLVDAFQGDEATSGLISWLKARKVTQIDLAVCTHAHGDHYGGFYSIVNAGIRIKEFRCYHIDSIRGGNAASRQDSDNLLELIRWLQARGTRVLFVDHGDVLKIGDVSWHIYRDQPAHAAGNDTNAWEYVNNGSLVLYSPELEGMLPGDGPDEPKAAIAYFQKKFGKVKILTWFDISHHGNAFSRSNAEAAKNAGAVIAFESCVEKNGPGTSEWTEFGAQRVRQQGITVWMQNADIHIHAEYGRIVFRQGDKTVSANIPYQGIAEGWGKDSKGWFYIKDGKRMTGWHKIKWSKGDDWFLFSPEGVMLTGWQKSKWSGGNDWFRLNPNTGAMQTGWIFVDGSWYYLDPKTGAMRTGWMDWKGKRCYLEPSVGRNQGHCYVNCTATIDGSTYRFDKDGYATEISGGKSCLHGVDIASYQSGINPAKLSTTDFVIVKFTQGTSYLNPHADRQYSMAKSAGKLLGAYHYAEGKDAKAEAGYFVRSLGSRVGECILALDWEGNQNGKFGTGQDVTWCRTFLDEVHRLTGIRALIYMSKSVCRKYDWSSVAGDYPLWCAQYKTNSITDYQPSPWTDDKGFGAWDKDTIRQYSSHGRIAGYDANIDLDMAYLSADQWRAMASGKPQESPVDVLLSIAEAEVGTHEGANNSTKYGDEMHALQPRNMDKNAAWCDAFVDWCILKTCQHFGKGADTARAVLCGDFDDYTYNSVALYKKAGRWSQTPHRGDQIFFGGSGHTGIVTFVGSGVIKTIEGNKGDEVRRCSYSTSSPSIIGYGHPRFDLITGTVTAADMPLIKRGSTGSAVLQLQKLLNKLGYGLEEDGSFGPATDAAVRAYQKAHGLEVDGEVGPMTWGKLLN